MCVQCLVHNVQISIILLTGKGHVMLVFLIIF